MTTTTRCRRRCRSKVLLEELPHAKVWLCTTCDRRWASAELQGHLFALADVVPRQPSPDDLETAP